MVYDRVDTLEEMQRDIMSVTVTQMQDIANELSPVILQLPLLC